MASLCCIVVCIVRKSKGGIEAFCPMSCLFMSEESCLRNITIPSIIREIITHKYITFTVITAAMKEIQSVCSIRILYFVQKYISNQYQWSSTIKTPQRGYRHHQSSRSTTIRAASALELLKSSLSKYVDDSLVLFHSLFSTYLHYICMSRCHFHHQCSRS